ncbi:hypothetical protein NDU88_002788 [Pleurodeles waltl]|uniref:Uncharacterized protein n=1 Tax=Pleurodeles waltl TaxID=8319 RepID=A0AAV7M1N4_PLEWA|nr:hypothetical protein NDU88_002788 [Pleurodeles waltl]
MKTKSCGYVQFCPIPEGIRAGLDVPWGTAQRAGVEVKPLFHASSTAQDVEPQQAGRRREEEKGCRQGNKKEEDEVGNEEEIGDANKEEDGNMNEEDEGSWRKMARMEEIVFGQQGTSKWSSHPEG